MDAEPLVDARLVGFTSCGISHTVPEVEVFDTERLVLMLLDFVKVVCGVTIEKAETSLESVDAAAATIQVRLENFICIEYFSWNYT